MDSTKNIINIVVIKEDFMWDGMIDKYKVKPDRYLYSIKDKLDVYRPTIVKDFLINMVTEN